MGGISQLYREFQHHDEASLREKRATNTSASTTMVKFLIKAQVGEVIQRRLEVTYKVSGVGLILKELGMSLQ